KARTGSSPAFGTNREKTVEISTVFFFYRFFIILVMVMKDLPEFMEQPLSILTADSKAKKPLTATLIIMLKIGPFRGGHKSLDRTILCNAKEIVYNKKNWARMA
ncbi:MAG: hypothetical protein PWP38_2524, partial [Clostridiales bacterium]|nr:hypothetical protein [Clostridiales bacterium]